MTQTAICLFPSNHMIRIVQVSITVLCTITVVDVIRSSSFISSVLKTVD